MSKDFLRNQILGIRTQMSAGEVATRTQKIFDNFKSKTIHNFDFKKNKKIGFYFPIKNEVDIRPFFEFCKKEKKTLLFPKTLESTIEFYQIHELAELKPGKFGTMEPKGSSSETPELIFVPGIAYDKKGYRLGYGAGYYDRYLSNKKIILIGLGYEFQIIDSIPHESHDVPLNFVVSEKHSIEIKK